MNYRNSDNDSAGKLYQLFVPIDYLLIGQPLPIIVINAQPSEHSLPSDSLF